MEHEIRFQCDGEEFVGLVKKITRESPTKNGGVRRITSIVALDGSAIAINAVEASPSP